MGQGLRPHGHQEGRRTVLFLRRGVLLVVEPARRRLGVAGRQTVGHRRVCLDRLRLLRRADALRRILAEPQQLLRHLRPGWSAQGPLLPLPLALEHRGAHRPPVAALVVGHLKEAEGKPHRTGDARLLLYRLCGGRALCQRQEPGTHQEEPPGAPRPLPPALERREV